MKKLILTALFLLMLAGATQVWAVRIQPYNGFKYPFDIERSREEQKQEDREWENEQRLRDLEDRQQRMEDRREREIYERSHTNPYGWPSSKPGDSLFK
jgi:TolA-binding protein